MDAVFIPDIFIHGISLAALLAYSFASMLISIFQITLVLVSFDIHVMPQIYIARYVYDCHDGVNCVKSR